MTPEAKKITFHPETEMVLRIWFNHAAGQEVIETVHDLDAKVERELLLTAEYLASGKGQAVASAYPEWTRGDRTRVYAIAKRVQTAQAIADESTYLPTVSEAYHKFKNLIQETIYPLEDHPSAPLQNEPHFRYLLQKYTEGYSVKQILEEIGITGYSEHTVRRYHQGLRAMLLEGRKTNCFSNSFIDMIPFGYFVTFGTDLKNEDPGPKFLDLAFKALNYEITQSRSENTFDYFRIFLKLFPYLHQLYEEKIGEVLDELPPRQSYLYTTLDSSDILDYLTTYQYGPYPFRMPLSVTFLLVDIIEGKVIKELTQELKELNTPFADRTIEVALSIGLQTIRGILIETDTVDQFSVTQQKKILQREKKMRVKRVSRMLKEYSQKG